MRRFCQPRNKRTDQQRVSQLANQSHGNIRRIEVGHYQDIGPARQISLRINSLAQCRIKGAQHMHLTIYLHRLVPFAQNFCRLTYFFRGRRIGRAKVLMGQQGDFGFNAKACDQVHTGFRNGGELLRRRINIHGSVCQKQRAIVH